MYEAGPRHDHEQFESERSKKLRIFLFNNPTVITAPQRVYVVDPYRFHTEATSTITTTIISAAPREPARSIQEFEEFVGRFWTEVDNYFGAKVAKEDVRTEVKRK